MTRNKTIPIIIYLIGFSIVLYYNLTHELVNDGVWEYLAYKGNIEVGWVFRNTLVNSCIISVWVPAIIQKITHIDMMLLFRIWPAFIYPLMPMFVYLIAHKYYGVKYAVIAAAVILANSHFIYFPDIGRVGISLGLFAGLVWAVLNKRWAWGIAFSILTVLAHYGLSVISVGAMFVVVFFVLIYWRKELKPYLIIFAVLVVLTGAWHFGVARYSGFAMLNTGLQTDVPQSGFNPTEFLLVQFDEFYTIESRSPEVQKAFFQTWGEESTPARIELIANWLIVLLISLGLLKTLRDKSKDIVLKAMMIACYGLICMTVFVPWLSIFYGATRSLFTGMIALALCFPVGVEMIASKLKIPMVIICVLVLGLYALSTTGLIYISFGLFKTFPVLVRLT